MKKIVRTGVRIALDLCSANSGTYRFNELTTFISDAH